MILFVLEVAYSPLPLVIWRAQIIGGWKEMLQSYAGFGLNFGG